MVKKFKKYSILLVLAFVSVFIGISGIFFSIKPSLLQEISFSEAVYDDHSRLLRLTLSADDKYRYFSPLDKISPELISSTLLQEDQYFFRHPGFNPVATLKATWQTYVVKSRRIGASTITMQLARMRYGLYSKNMSGKLWQILYAIRLELHYSKKELLEAYLNLAPYGNNIEGIGAASLIYFAKPAEELSLPESLVLSVIPQNPVKSTANFSKLKESRDKLATRWLEKHPEDRSQENLLRLPIQLQPLKNLPFLAPHFVNSVLQEKPKKQAIVTTLDLKIQKIIEQVTKRYIDRKKYQGVYNASVMLVDTRDMSIKAYMGSADFFNPSIAGQIDGPAVKRSPGSALKPFIYGLALDQGLIHPNTVLKDVPRSFGTYNPENFDYEFVGPVKAKDALVLSRNIPAIYLAEQLKQPSLYEFLKEGYVQLAKSENYYGLALVLGGAELSMQELASLYAMLVNDGIWHELRWQTKAPLKSGTRLLSPEASFLVLDMLKDSEHDHIPVSWKTGTSSGFRDAWSVGAFGPYVMVVWLGNFNNRSNPAFVGKSLAAPLMFELIQALDSESGPLMPIYKNPNNLHLAKVKVCKASGMLPTRYCQDTEITWFIPGRSPIKTDTIFREIAIDKKTGLRTCEINANTTFKIYEFWSSDLLRIFKQAGIQRRIPPAFMSSCHSDATGFAPQITSPRQTNNYVIRNYALQGNKVPLTATVDADVKKIYWFINESFLGEIQPEQAYLLSAKPGKYIVRVVDDHGRSDAIDLVVKSNNPVIPLAGKSTKLIS